MELYAAPQLRVRIGGRRRLNLCMMGEGAPGSPTVVLFIGLAGLTIDWARVQPFVARFARAVSFDHAGMGFSDPGRPPRTSSAIVADLRAALQAADLPPPYVLVGHSAGGLHMRLFAGRYPDEVAGLVYVDAVSPYWEQRLFAGPCPSLSEARQDYRRLLALARAGRLDPSAPEYARQVGLPRADLTPRMNQALEAMWRRPAYLRALISESVEQGRRSAEEVAALPASLGDLPLIALSAGRIDLSPFVAGDEGRVRRWREMHQDMAAQSARGVMRVVDGGHHLPAESPRAVVAAIREVVEAAA